MKDRERKLEEKERENEKSDEQCKTINRKLLQTITIIKTITRIKYEHAKVADVFFSSPLLNVRPCETCNRKVIGGEECFNGATWR